MATTWRARLRSRHAILVGLLTSLALVASACGGSEQPQGGAATDVDSIEIVTSPVGGTFHTVGAALASRLQDELGIPVTATPSSGTGQNIVLLQEGDAELAVAASNGIVPAYAGVKPYEQPHQKLRLVAHLYPNALLLFALADSGLERVSDLEGARVGVGKTARTWDHFMRPLFESQGLEYGKNMTPVYAGFSDMARQVRDGQLDAAIATGGANSPSAAFTQLAAERDVVLLAWDQQSLEATLDDIPYMQPYPFPADALQKYPGDAYDTVDIGGPYLTVTADMPDDVVYQIAKTFHTTLDSMAKDVALLRWVAQQPDEFFTKQLGDVQFHDGAIQYWREVGAME